MYYDKIYKKEFKLALKKIKEYDRICVFRHQRPDGDAFGTQMGLVTWLRDNFPSKSVHYVGEDSGTYSENLFPKMEQVDDSWFDNPFLAIIVDTGDTKRISDERYKKAQYKIKFDHHPNVEPYGDLNIVANEIAACAELVADFCYSYSKKYPLSKNACKYFFTGIVTDSGRFQFPSTTKETFDIAGMLLTSNLKPNKEVYLPLYEKDVESLKFQKYVLNNMVFTPKGVAYYTLMQKDLDELGIDNERGKEHLSLMSNIKNVPIWFCVTEISEKNEFRVSIRSKEIDISVVATKYRGGGHKNASGATLLSMDELPSLIKDLEDLI
jgi:bifunctional oligoribonuclease and PAP phosphatase NrnA